MSVRLYSLVNLIKAIQKEIPIIVMGVLSFPFALNEKNLTFSVTIYLTVCVALYYVYKALLRKLGKC